MADLINILRCTYKGPGEGSADWYRVAQDLSKIPYSRIMMGSNDVTSEIEQGGGGLTVTGERFTLDFYLTGTNITIGARTFESLSLESVNVPSIVKKLGSYTFANNTGLTDIILNEGLEDIGFNEAGEEYTGRTFEGITKANITVPSTVRHIGQNSFYNWEYPHYIHFMSETPPTIDDNGEGTFGQSSATLFVPKGTVNAYKSATRDMYWPYIEEYDPNVSNKSIANAYAGEDAVMKIYLGANLIYSCETCNQIGLCGDAPNCYPCTCGDFSMCGDYPDCHDCTCEEQYSEPADICECEGKYWYGDECHDEPEDPCSEYEEGTQEKCECQGLYWYDDGCHDSPADPCAGMEQEYEDCINGGGVWDADNCLCQADDPCVEDPCSCDPCLCVEPGTEDECICQGGTWDGEECQFE